MFTILILGSEYKRHKQNYIKVDDNGRLLEKVKIPDLDAVDDPCNTERTEIEKKSKEYFDKIKEGLSLFSKYYMDLWD